MHIHEFKKELISFYSVDATNFVTIYAYISGSASVLLCHGASAALPGQSSIDNVSLLLDDEEKDGNKFQFDQEEVEREESIENVPAAELLSIPHEADTVLDCSDTAMQIFGEKVEGSFVQVLKNTIEFKTVTKFRGKVDFVRHYDNSTTLDYDISFEIRFEAYVERKQYLGLCSVDSLTTSDIPSCDILKIVWYGNNVPVGSIYQQCDSLIKTYKVRKCLIEKLKMYEDSCIETFNKRYGWGLSIVHSGDKDKEGESGSRRCSRKSNRDSMRSKMSSHSSDISLGDGR